MADKSTLSDEEIKKVAGGDFEIAQTCGACGVQYRYSVEHCYFYCPKCGGTWKPAES